MSSRTNVVVRAPRRKTRKEIANGQFAPGTGGVAVVDTIFTCDEDGETLVRIVGTIDVQYAHSGASGTGHCGIALVISRDVSLPGSLITNLTGREAETILWHAGLKFSRVQNVVSTRKMFHIDIKSKRKMRKGDKIEMVFDAISASPEVFNSLTTFALKP